MYASVNQWSFGEAMSAASCLEAAGKLGFAGFEAAFNESGPLSFEDFEKDAKALRKRADELDVRLPSLASGLYWKYPYSSEDAKIREKSQAITKRQIDCAAQMGAPAILVVPGTVGKGFFGTGVRYRDAYARAQEALFALEPYARSAGITIGVENVWNNFLLSPAEMAAFLDEIGSPFIKCYFDVGNVILYGESADWIETLGSRIACIHVKDFRRAVGNESGFVPLMEGDVDWPAVIPALGAAGFDGALTAEVGPVKYDPIFAAKQAALALSTILAMRQ